MRKFPDELKRFVDPPAGEETPTAPQDGEGTGTGSNAGEGAE